MIKWPLVRLHRAASSHFPFKAFRIAIFKEYRRASNEVLLYRGSRASSLTDKYDLHVNQREKQNKVNDSVATLERDLQSSGGDPSHNQAFKLLLNQRRCEDGLSMVRHFVPDLMSVVTGPSYTWPLLYKNSQAL